MQYSPSAHAAGSSGFFFDSDKSAPADSFEVAQADVTAAINLPSTQAYSFAAPTEEGGTGTLAISAAAAPSATQVAIQQAAAAFSAGLTIVCTSTPALNGTYPIDPTTQNKIASVELFIQKNSAFPGTGGSSIAWYDTSNTPHIFPSITIFGEFATAVANYVADLDLYAAGAPGASLPSATVTIA